MFCKRCGAELAEDQVFCTVCGEAVNDAPVVNDAPIIEEKKERLHVGMFVWSLINMLICCQPAGIIALIFTLLARYEEKVKADKYLGIAKICNIIGTVIGALVLVAVIIYVVFVIFMFGILMGSATMYY